MGAAALFGLRPGCLSRGRRGGPVVLCELLSCPNPQLPRGARLRAGSVREGTGCAPLAGTRHAAVPLSRTHTGRPVRPAWLTWPLPPAEQRLQCWFLLARGQGGSSEAGTRPRKQQTSLLKARGSRENTRAHPHGSLTLPPAYVQGTKRNLMCNG